MLTGGRRIPEEERKREEESETAAETFPYAAAATAEVTAITASRN